MRNQTLAVAAAALALTLSLAPSLALAHHSFAMFDRTRSVMLQGVVKDFTFTNPHSWIQIDSGPADGKAAQEWSVELGSPNMMQRQGWHSWTLKPGDKVGMMIRPKLDGSAAGSLISVTMSDGKVLGPGGAPAPATGNAPIPQ